MRSAGVVAAIALTLLVALAFVPLRVSASGQARLDPRGAWAAALGVSCRGVALTLVAASGVDPLLFVHLLGRRVYTRSAASLLARLSTGDDRAPERTLSQRFDDLAAAYDRFTERLDPAELFTFLVEETRRVELSTIDVVATFAADDIATTGMITGQLHVLSSMLSPHVHIDPRPDWLGDPRAQLEATGWARFSPALLALDLLRFASKHLRLRPVKKPA